MRETSIKSMIEDMRELIESAGRASLDGRSANAMIELMPPFLRFLDRERRSSRKGIRRGDNELLDEFLQMVTLPLVNMTGRGAHDHRAVFTRNAPSQPARHAADAAA